MLIPAELHDQAAGDIGIAGVADVLEEPLDGGGGETLVLYTRPRVQAYSGLAVVREENGVGRRGGVAAATAQQLRLDSTRGTEYLATDAVLLQTLGQSGRGSGAADLRLLDGLEDRVGLAGVGVAEAPGFVREP